MKIIAHRANLNGSNPIIENTIREINKCIEYGYDVEIDVRVIEDEIFLGHNSAENIIKINEINEISEYLWIHCKNLKALEYFSQDQRKNIYNFFWHDKDEYTLTSKGYIWSYPGSELSINSVCVMPEWSIEKENLNNLTAKKIYGICTDYPELLKVKN